MKKRGTHSSLIDGAVLITSILHKNDIQFSPGIIKTSLSNTNKYLQIIENHEKKIKLIVRDSISLQEIKLFKSNTNGDKIRQIFLEDKKIKKLIAKGFKVISKNIN